MKHEQDMQRFLQIRDEIQDEIKKIDPSVALLHETTKRFVAQVEVFQKRSQQVQDDIKSAIKGGSHEMAHLAAGEFCEKVDSKIEEILKTLDQSVHHASDVLERISRKNKVKGVVLSTLLICIALLLGFEGGQAYQESRTHALPKAFLEPYQRGEKSPKTAPKSPPKNNMKKGHL